ncbi:hypothetical protein XENORESO_019061 [Xenotaenia resolanae]|uniref:Uncharacterized protein n=1 Tax=Xenotaenia resolanae TaxID=208358 RepID=A0ABV0WS91_9TELE
MIGANPFPPLDAAGARGTPEVTGAARSSISQCTIRGRTASTSAAECFATSGVASCSRLASSQEIHKTTTNKDYYLNLCSAGSLQRLVHSAIRETLSTLRRLTAPATTRAPASPTNRPVLHALHAPSPWRVSYP